MLAVAGALAISTLPVRAAELLVGEIHPITGPASFYGAPMSNAIKLAIKEINDAGGIKAGGESYTLTLLSGDDQGNPTTGVAALRKVIGDGAKYIFGTLASGVAPALKPVMDANPDVTQIVDGTLAPGIVNGKNIFRNQTTQLGYDAPIVDLVKFKKYKTVAVMTDRFHSGNMGNEQKIVDAMTANGAEVVAREYLKLNDTDFSAQLTNIAAKKPDAIVLRTYPNEAALITKQSRQLGYEGQIIWNALSPPATVLKNISDAEMNGILNGYAPEISDYVALGEANAIRMADAYKAMFNADPGELSALSYDAVYILKAAIEKAGSVENDKVNAALQQLKVADLPNLVNPYQAHPDGRLFDDEGEVIFTGTPHIWKDGRWHPYPMQ
jgi:branched-chain amino acid transport system substrate-binding protein